jgi:hypothetical protein
MPTCVRRDEDPVVAHVQQSVGGLDRDGLAGEMASNVIAVLEDADAPGAVDPAAHGVPGRFESLFGRGIGVDDLRGRLSGELEPPDRCDIADRLMLSVEVVVGDPCIELGLRVLDRCERSTVEQLFYASSCAAVRSCRSSWVSRER